MIPEKDRIRGSLIGGAIGDALGYPVEFIYDYRTIQKKYGEEGITRYDTRHCWKDESEQDGKALLPDNAVVKHLPGNHDVLISEGKVDNTPFTSRYGEDRFVYMQGKFCIIGINSSLIKHNDPREEEQYEWLKATLEEAGKIQ